MKVEGFSKDMINIKKQSMPFKTRNQEKVVKAQAKQDIFDIQPSKQKAMESDPAALEDISKKTLYATVNETMRTRENSEPYITDSGFITSQKMQDELWPKGETPHHQGMVRNNVSIEDIFGKGGQFTVTVLSTGEKYICGKNGERSEIINLLHANKHHIYEITGTEEDQLHNGRVQLMAYQTFTKNLGSRIEKEKQKLGITEDVTLSWNILEGSFKIQGVTDEVKKAALERALANMSGLSNTLNDFSMKDMIVNGRVDELAYPAINTYLNENFGVGIDELRLSQNGKVISNNPLLNKFLSQDNGNPMNTGYPELPYRMTTLNDALPELIKNGRPMLNPVFHYEIKNGDFLFQTDTIKIGSDQLTPEQKENRKFLLRFQYFSFVGIGQYYSDKHNAVGIFKEV